MRDGQDWSLRKGILQHCSMHQETDSPKQSCIEPPVTLKGNSQVPCPSFVGYHKYVPDPQLENYT